MEIFHDKIKVQKDRNRNPQKQQWKQHRKTARETDDRNRIAGGESNRGSCQRYTRRKKATGAGEGRFTGIPP